jgi:hypothetical protein
MSDVRYSTSNLNGVCMYVCMYVEGTAKNLPI